MQCHRAVRQELNRDAWCGTMNTLSLGLTAVEALSPGRGHTGQSRVRGNPAAEMCLGVQASCRVLWGTAVGEMGTECWVSLSSWEQMACVVA